MCAEAQVLVIRGNKSWCRHRHRGVGAKGAALRAAFQPQFLLQVLILCLSTHLRV